MVNRYLYIFVTFLLVSESYGQSLFSLGDYYNDSSKMTMGILGEYDVNSTALTNELYYKAINGSYIKAGTKDRVDKRLSEYNKAGLDLNYGLFFSQRIDSLFRKERKGFHYFIKIAGREHSNMVFTEDLFRVAMYGNARFAGDTAKMGSSEFNLLRYQQLEVGIIGSFKGSSKYGIGLSFIKGEQFYNSTISRANLYTSQSGDHVDLDLKYSITQSDTSYLGFDAMHGWGMSMDLFYQMSYNIFQMKGPSGASGPGSGSSSGQEGDPSASSGQGNETDWTGYLRIEVSDLGFISWNDKTVQEQIDTMYQFDGVEIQNILQLSDSIFDPIVDSLKQIYQPTYSQNSYTTILPTLFHLSIYQEKNSGFYISLGTVFRIFANYSPFIYLKAGHTLKEKFRLGGSLEFGGYGKINLGFQAEADLSGFKIGLGTHSLDGFIFPKRTGRNSVYLSVAKRF